MEHRVTMEEREKLTLTGATEVLHFDEELARLETCKGTVSVHGRGLKLKCLSLDGGLVSVTGEICAVIYEEQREKRGLGRWLG